MLNLLNYVKITKLTTANSFNGWYVSNYWLESGIYDSYYIYFVESGLLLTLDFL